ncbi:M16 family metallopeptidase [Rhizosaccharibacter radicis]|uniref:Insulinase family protein n=1 Tax=Rhizosaccharibacter radicis TaxID=2782605 RepID=A0ABT1VT44_9PROT|nr:insulinase family protein [Acetobacteraceae bacterium KSS12]
MMRRRTHSGHCSLPRGAARAAAPVACPPRRGAPALAATLPATLLATLLAGTPLPALAAAPPPDRPATTVQPPPGEATPAPPRPSPATPVPAAQKPTAPDAALRATLENGLRVVIIPDRLAPVVTTEINYLAGSNDAPPGFPGTAHALEHMMFRGSAGLDRDQLSELGARLGGGYNADTTETVTQYYYTAPAEDLAVALKVEALRMNGLSLRAEDWDKERGAIEQEVSRDLSSPVYSYLSQLQAAMFAGTPYEHDALGTRPSFDKTDVKLLRGFYERWYAPNNAILVIAGDVDPPRALQQVKDAFGAIPRRTLPARKPFTLTPVQARTIHLPTDYPIGIATLAWRMPGLKAKDFAAADILGDVLGSQRAALYGLVPAGRALATQFSFQPKPDVGFAIAVGGFPKGSDPAPLLASMRGVIADTVAHGVDPALVQAAKTHELAQLGYRADSISGLANSWSQALAFQNLDSPDAIAAAYEAVTPDDVNRVARQFLQPAGMITAILTPQESPKPIAGKGFGGAESFASAPEKPVALPDWAANALRELRLPTPAPAPVVSTLPNGLRLIVQPEHVTSTVSVYGQIRQDTDLQEPPGKEGVSSVLDRMFDYGTERLDRLAFQKALDDIAAEENAGSTFSLKVPSRHFEDGLSLLAENELHPALPAAAFPVVQRQVAGQLAGLLASPDYLFERASVQAVVPPHDPALREATPHSVMALSLADVRGFVTAAYRPDLATIVVIGDVTPERARAAVEKSFGNWQASGPKPAVDLPPIPPNKSGHAYVPDRTSLQASAALLETLGARVDDPAHFTLTLGNEILGGGFSSRLYRDLRVKTGYVYSVSSALRWSRERSSYAVQFGADPGNVSKARDLVVRDLRDMAEHPVPAPELDRAKASLLRQIPLGRASFDAIGYEYLHLADLGLPLDQPDIAARHYLDTTPAQLQDAFRRWVRPDDLATVVKGPPGGG